MVFWTGTERLTKSLIISIQKKGDITTEAFFPLAFPESCMPSTLKDERYSCIKGKSYTMSSAGFVLEVALQTTFSLHKFLRSFGSMQSISTLFVDLEKAYARVLRGKLWKLLVECCTVY